MIVNLLTIFLIYILVAILWQIAEKMIYGVVTPRKIDGVIAMILAISLFFNFK